MTLKSLGFSDAFAGNPRAVAPYQALPTCQTLESSVSVSAVCRGKRSLHQSIHVPPSFLRTLTLASMGSREGTPGSPSREPTVGRRQLGSPAALLGRPGYLSSQLGIPHHPACSLHQSIEVGRSSCTNPPLPPLTGVGSASWSVDSPYLLPASLLSTRNLPTKSLACLIHLGVCCLENLKWHSCHHYQLWKSFF